MFKFDFNIEDRDCGTPNSRSISTEVNAEQSPQDRKTPPLVTYQVQNLIKHLPPFISYSPLRIPLSSNQSLTLLRRDLFDARFQLISESITAEISEELEFIDAPSDLVPGVYEGGLKTWECSADLAGYLAGADIPDYGHKILEVGCGTAVPSLNLLHRIFHVKRLKDSTEKPRTTFHLQDYNSIVLQLVTLPNIVLTWYASPASESYRVNLSPPVLDTNVSEPGELPLTPELLSAFLESLREHNIDLTFVSGTWSDMDMWIREGQHSYDLILTSETIYRPSSFSSLISLLRSSSTPHKIPLEDESQGFPHRIEHLSLQSTNPSVPYLCLVAAKVIYFGVGGGIAGFERAVEETGGRVKTVFETKAGVSRRILQVTWPQNQESV